MDINNQDQPEPNAHPNSESGEVPFEEEIPSEPAAGTESSSMSMDIDNQDQPDLTTNPDLESGGVTNEKEGITEIAAGTDLPSEKPKAERPKGGRFHFLKSFITGLFSKRTKANQTLITEIKAHEDSVEKRLEKLVDEQPEVESESLLSEELPEEEDQPSLILTNLSQDILPNQPQPENPPAFIEEESVPSEESIPFERTLTPLLPEDLDEFQRTEEEVVSSEEEEAGEKIRFDHVTEEGEISEDEDLKERFQAFTSSEETTGPFPQAFMPEDLEDLNAVGEEEDEGTTGKDAFSFETTESKDVSQSDLPDYWNKAFTTDPIPLADVPPTLEIEKEDEQDKTEEYPSSFQERIAQSRIPEDEKDDYSLIIQDGLAQTDTLPEEKEEYPADIDEGLAQPAEAIEEEGRPISWDVEPDWSSVAKQEEALRSTSPSENILEGTNQLESAAAIPAKKGISVIPKFLRILIIFLIVIDVAIIVIAGNSYFRVIAPPAPTPTVVPTEVRYVYPNGLVLPGGWIIQLNKGHIVDNKWTPVSAEWLIDTTFRRVVALPWSKQLEAVVLTLQKGDPVNLYMVNNDVINYQVEQVMKVPQTDTSFLERNTPALIIILYRTDNQDRWVIICGEK